MLWFRWVGAYTTVTCMARKEGNGGWAEVGFISQSSHQPKLLVINRLVTFLGHFTPKSNARFEEKFWIETDDMKDSTSN